LADLEARK